MLFFFISLSITDHVDDVDDRLEECEMICDRYVTLASGEIDWTVPKSKQFGTKFRVVLWLRGKHVLTYSHFVKCELREMIECEVVDENTVSWTFL